MGHRAWLDVRKGRRWTGACVPGDVTVDGEELRFTITERRHERRERLAVGRLPDDRALAQLLGPEALVIRVPRAVDTFSFPWFPALGRTTIRIRQGGHADMVLKFLDLGDPLMTNPFRLLFRALVGGPAARRERDAVRAELERRLREPRQGG